MGGTGVVGVTFNGVDKAIFYFRDDANMIRSAILHSGSAVFVIPVEEDDHAGGWYCSSVQPLSALLEPLHANRAAGKLGDDAKINVSAFVGTPGNKAGTPFHMRMKAVPTPIGFSTDISQLRLCDGHKLFVGVMDATSCGSSKSEFTFTA